LEGSGDARVRWQSCCLSVESQADVIFRQIPHRNKRPLSAQGLITWLGAASAASPLFLRSRQDVTATARSVCWQAPCSRHPKHLRPSPPAATQLLSWTPQGVVLSGRRVRTGGAAVDRSQCQPLVLRVGCG
jgi:hypothetical protein